MTAIDPNVMVRRSGWMLDIGQRVTHRSIPKRRGTVVEVHPFGELQVLWDGWKRPETVLNYDLRTI
jgi:hypothetical protein